MCVPATFSLPLSFFLSRSFFFLFLFFPFSLSLSVLTNMRPRGIPTALPTLPSAPPSPPIFLPPPKSRAPLVSCTRTRGVESLTLVPQSVESWCVTRSIPTTSILPFSIVTSSPRNSMCVCRWAGVRVGCRRTSSPLPSPPVTPPTCVSMSSIFSLTKRCQCIRATDSSGIGSSSSFSRAF